VPTTTSFTTRADIWNAQNLESRLGQQVACSVGWASILVGPRRLRDFLHRLYYAASPSPTPHQLWSTNLIVHQPQKVAEYSPVPFFAQLTVATQSSKHRRIL
jgi:hypothetical protein